MRDFFYLRLAYVCRRNRLAPQVRELSSDLELLNLHSSNAYFSDYPGFSPVYDELHELMSKCWDKDPDRRMTVSDFSIGVN